MVTHSACLNVRMSRNETLRSHDRPGCRRPLLDGLLTCVLAALPLVLTAPAHGQATWNGTSGATWNTSATNWLNASGTPWDATNGATSTAVFAWNTGANGTTNISGTVNSNILRFTGSNGMDIQSGTLNLAGTSPTIDIPGTGSVRFLGSTSGSSGFTKSGAGRLTISSGANNNALTGTITVQAGNLDVNPTGFGSTVTDRVNITGGVLGFTNGISQSIRPLYFSNAGGLRAINGSGGYSGYSGFIEWDSTGSIATESVNSGLLLSGTLSLIKTATFSLNSLTTGSTSLISGNIIGTGGLWKTGTNGLRLTGSNTFSGTTSLHQGTLSIENVNALVNSTLETSPSGAGVRAVTFTLSGSTYRLGGLSGALNVANNGSTLAIGGNNATTTYSGTLSGAGGLTKGGTGGLILSGSNSYSGATAINAGMLHIASAGSINSTSGITLNGAGAELKYNSATALTQPITFTQGTISGTGTIGTAVTVGTNHVLSPGNSPGIQAYTSGLTFAPGGQYTWEINSWSSAAGTAYDQLAVSGSPLNITATSGSTFKILVTSLTGSNTAGAVSGFVGTTGTTFTIATSSPAITGFDRANFTVDSTTAFGNVNTLPTNAGFWLSTNSGSTSLILNYAPSATYNLSAAASATVIRVGGTSTITATVTSSTASLTNPDTMSYGGLTLTGSGGLGALSSTSGTVTPGSSSSGNAAFSPVVSGSYTFNPSVSTATNVNIGTSANAGTTSGVTVSAWNPAVATTSGSVNLGTVIVGATSSWTQALSITNSAPNDGFSEKLNASFGTLSGVMTNSSSFTLLAANATNNTALMVSLATGSVGNQSGSAQILFATDGQGTSGLAPASLAPQTVNVYGTVLDHATPGFVGVLDPLATGTLTLDFGSVDESAGLQTRTFSITNLYNALVGANLTAGLTLTGTDAGSGPFSLSGAGFSNLLAGDTSGLFTVSFTPSSQGPFSQQFKLSFSDNTSLAGAAARRDLFVATNVVVVPEPGAIALAGVGVAAAAWAFRRRR